MLRSSPLPIGIGETIMKPLQINPEKLAYWYFRVNGCFTFTNFIIHPDRGRGQRTDVDIMAVRLPYRSEILENSMSDDDVLLPEGNRIKAIPAEVKMGICNLICSPTGLKCYGL